MSDEAEKLARAVALAAVAPMEGHPLAFSLALEMATTNVANRIAPILDPVLRAAHEEGRRVERQAISEHCDEIASRIEPSRSGRRRDERYM